jgi:hypothetical protein
VHDRSSVVLAATDSWQAYESRQSNGARSLCATYESALFTKLFADRPPCVCLTSISASKYVNGLRKRRGQGRGMDGMISEWCRGAVSTRDCRLTKHEGNLVIAGSVEALSEGVDLSSLIVIRGVIRLVVPKIKSKSPNTSSVDFVGSVA